MIFDLALCDSLGWGVEFSQTGVADEEFDIVVIADLLAYLSEDLFFEGIDSFGDLDLNDYLFFFCN